MRAVVGVSGLVVMLLGLGAGAAVAQDLTTSPRPQPRPAVAQTQTSVAEAPAPGTMRVPRPMPRPALMAQTQALPPQPMLGASMPVVRPLPRPSSWRQDPPQIEVASANPAPAQPNVQAEPPKRRSGGLFGGLFGGNRNPDKPTPTDGFVCGDPDIRGDELARITSKVRGCGIEDPVRVTSVDGVRLTTPATIDCTTARALKTWIQEGMRPAFGRQEVVELRIAASYICRPRNNIRGAKISEHGRGKAVDISGFIFSDGREISVAGDYNRQMRRAHKAACGIFGTTLGPGSDGYHEDHLHFDTASHGNGAYCR